MSITKEKYWQDKHKPKLKLSKIGTPLSWKNTAAFAGTRASVRRHALTGAGNGSFMTLFFNGKAAKHLKRATGYVAPVYLPEPRSHAFPGNPTSRFFHKPWSLNNKKKVTK